MEVVVVVVVVSLIGSRHTAHARDLFGLPAKSLCMRTDQVIRSIRILIFK